MTKIHEIWKDIADYEGRYQVSNLGRVKSLARIKYPHYLSKEKILSVRPKKHGYTKVYLFIENNMVDFYVHRLVAMAFIEPVDGKPHINHINGIRNDNRVENLEWCTRSENSKHSYIIGIAKPKRWWLGKFNKTYCKKIAQYDLDGNFIKEFPSTREANRQLGISYASIYYALKGERRTASGFKWKFV